jgi:hypothetical protein
MRPGPALRVAVPGPYPRPVDEPLWAEDYLKAFATTQPIDLEPLLSPPLNGSRSAGRCSHPLARLLQARKGHHRARSIGFDEAQSDAEDWTSTLRCFDVAVAPRAAGGGSAGGMS